MILILMPIWIIEKAIVYNWELCLSCQNQSWCGCCQGCVQNSPSLLWSRAQCISTFSSLCLFELLKKPLLITENCVYLARIKVGVVAAKVVYRILPACYDQEHNVSQLFHHYDTPGHNHNNSLYYAILTMIAVHQVCVCSRYGHGIALNCFLILLFSTLILSTKQRICQQSAIDILLLKHGIATRVS